MVVASGSGWNLWVWLAGGECVYIVGVVVRRLDFLILLIPIIILLLYLLFFAAASLLFVNF